MAEGADPLVSNQRLLIAVSVVVLVITLFFLWTFRGCIPVVSGGGGGYTNIYTNLDLKDAANVIARLKELKISYKVSENGTAVAVPKDKASDARLGLAEKNLPQGGVVGWEIFNETRMGATDFDRRIQLIRAISGELSRTIRRIEGVEDARVQIVLPETRLFEVSKAPVTAAVLLKITLGKKLRSDQVNGIIHLVASSVENLKPENVTIVDDLGNILSVKPVPLGEEYAPRVTKAITLEAPIEQQILKKEILQTAEVTAKPEKPQMLTEEEKILLRLKAKEEYERQLTAKAQELLNQFYPPNSVIVRVSTIFGQPKSGEKSTKLKIHSKSGFILTSVKKITTIVLIDNRLKLSQKLKASTYQTIALAIPYDKKRGDNIILKQVPFHYAEVLPEKLKQGLPLLPKTEGFKYVGYFVWGAAAILILFLLFIIAKVLRPKNKEIYMEQGEAEFPLQVPTEGEATTTVKQIKDTARENPERIANLLKKWLTEEE